MKKLLILLLAFSLLFGFTACGSTQNDPQKIVDHWDRLVEMLGRTQITPDAKLIGIRTTGEDGYVGTYDADCNQSTGRDVVFGGGSVKARTVHLQGYVECLSGTAQIHARFGERVEELRPDENGNFEASYQLTGGGNYLMVDYAGFSGTITMTAFYMENAEA